MKPYLDLLRQVLTSGIKRSDRTGTGTLSMFGTSIHINLEDGFPLLTTKKMFYKAIFGELLWFIHGDTNIKYLNENGIHIWDGWADENGDLGPVYGKQWRDWVNYAGKHYDQLSTIIETIKNDPFSRRIILNSWNVGELEEMRLPPCHVLAQFYVRDNYIDCQVYQRSADLFLGVPFDIASYAALLYLICREVKKYQPGTLNICFGDSHIYLNHIEQAKIQLSRTPLELPNLIIKGNKDIYNLEIEDFVLNKYNFYPTIKAEVSL